MNLVSAYVRSCAGGLPCVSEPFEVDGGDVEDDPFEPEDHEETLREGTVADALSIIACLHAKQDDRKQVSVMKSDIKWNQWKNS